MYAASNFLALTRKAVQLQQSHWNHCPYLWTEALSRMVFAPAQKLSGINSNVDIKAKLTPSAGQVESDAVTVLWANTSEFMSFGHSIPIYSHFKTNFTALKRLFHADAHANHVELFPAASRWWFLVWLRLDVSMTCWSRSRSQFVVRLYQLCTSVLPRRFPSVEKRDKPSLTYISPKNSLPFAFPLEKCVCLGGTYSIQTQGRLQLF